MEAGVYAGSFDRRGNRLGGFSLTRSRDDDNHFVNLLADESHVGQIEAVLAGQGCCRWDVRPSDRTEFTHRLRYDGPPRTWLSNTLRTLEEVLTVPDVADIDALLVLDFYKDPSSHDDPQQWANTQAGAWVNGAKYTSNPLRRKKNGGALADKLADVIKNHRLLAQADCLISIPGHDQSHRSFGTQLAAAVASRVGEDIYQTRSRSRLRPQAKEAGQRDADELAEDFIVDPMVSGQIVLIVDDVVRSCTSMSAVAKSARAQGAAVVLGLGGAKTMRL